ncbi:MAG: hypothetical protein NTX88_07790, partial [Candidatus Atribacteria bacterium]|nr:hypothetical protein [Candidatus Atribacteria bacterium]
MTTGFLPLVVISHIEVLLSQLLQHHLILFPSTRGKSHSRFFLIHSSPLQSQDFPVSLLVDPDSQKST